MYQNYVFDLYGTLLDIHTDEHSKNFFKKYAKWLRKQGFAFSWREFYTDYREIEKRYRQQESKYQNPEIQVEDVFVEVFARKGYDISKQEAYELCESFRRISLIYLSLFPDTISCLKQLKKAGKKVYLLSNAQKSFTWQELEMTGILPYFDGVLISSEEGCMKPDPAFYQILCDRYCLDKKETIMIGNEIKSDMAGAAAAGIDGFYINRHPVFHDTPEAGYRYVSKSGSLLEVIGQTQKKGETC